MREKTKNHSLTNKLSSKRVYYCDIIIRTAIIMNISFYLLDYEALKKLEVEDENEDGKAKDFKDQSTQFNYMIIINGLYHVLIYSKT